jgi:hypothetical protein
MIMLGCCWVDNWEEGEWRSPHHGKSHDSVLFHQRTSEWRVCLEHVGAVFFVTQVGFLVAVNGEAEHFALAFAFHDESCCCCAGFEEENEMDAVEMNGLEMKLWKYFQTAINV